MRLTAEFLQLTVLGNTVALWLIAGAILIGVAVVLFVSRTIVAKRLEAIANRTATEFDDLLVNLLSRTRYYFIAAIALSAAAVVLVLPMPARQTIRVVTILAITMQTAAWGNGVITFWLKSYAARRAAIDGASVTTIGAFGVLARIALWTVVVLVAIDNLGYNVTALVTGLGIGGVAVALAVQNILGDLFGALSIVIDKPFVVGDTIAVDTITGTVEHVGLKSTRVRSVAGEQVIFSNSDLLKSRIRNFKRQQERRVVLTTAVAYETPPETLARVPDMLREIVESHPEVRFDRSHFFRFGESSLDFETVYMVTTADYLVHMNVQQAINLEILRRFRDEKIEIPYPTRTVQVWGRPTDGAVPKA
jgi:small-conductance mechanosensitive channel